MLKTRILTALVLAPLLLAAVWFLPDAAFAALMAVVIAAGAWEWSALCGLHRKLPRWLFCAAFVLLAMLAWWLAVLPLVALVVLPLWVAAIILVLVYPVGAGVLRQPLLAIVFAQALLLGGFAGVVAIRQLDDGAFWLIWTLFIVWAADIGAYFAGRALGRRKLAPALSPGKTWEGAIGGMLLALAIAVPLALWREALGMATAFALALVLAALSVFGDLFESALKRSSGVKDSGGLLPGHGGLLDRIDSLLVALPAAVVALHQLV